MKIPLIYANSRLILNATLYCSGTHGGLVFIPFVLDTGNPKTFISEGDAMRASLPINKSSNYETIKMGGSTYQLTILKRPSSMFVKDINGKSNKIILSNLKIARCTKTSGKDKEASFNFPSLIGMDFLEKNNFILHCDLKNNDCYLELKE